MNSKEAFEEIIKVCNYYHRQISNFDCVTICGYPIKNIERDLEVLDILKKSIYNKTESKYSLITEFVVLDLFIKGEDVVKVKEWLENEN